jgi:hypothetical protein
MHKNRFGQAYCQEQLKRIPKKFIFYFFKSYCIYYEFVKFIRIPGIKIEKGNWKTERNSNGSSFGPRPSDLA